MYSEEENARAEPGWMKRIGPRNLSYDFVTICHDFTIFVTIRYDFRSVSSDQVCPLCFLDLYILRVESGQMKRIEIEISVTIFLRFSYDFVAAAAAVGDDSSIFICMSEGIWKALGDCQQ